MATTNNVISESIINFSWDLLRLLINDSANQNYLISPVSLAAALSMTLTGARGITAQEMISTLHYTGIADAPNTSNEKLHQDVGAALKAATASDTLQMANRIYTEKQYRLAESFLSLVKKAYNSDIQSVDFKGSASKICKEINDWVAEVTHKKIMNILPESAINDLTRMVLVNAVYFKGAWKKQFNPKHTTPETFHITPNKEIKVEMMFLKDKMRYTANFNFDPHTMTVKSPTSSAPGGNDVPKYQACALPFTQSDTSKAALFFVVILPHDMQEFSEAMKDKSGMLANGAWLKAILNKLFVNPNITEVELKLPKFKLAPEGSSVKKYLEDLGMSNMFCDNANFSGFATPGQEIIAVDDVFHKAMMEVNEEGAEAAAATAVVMSVRCAVVRAPNIIMTVNKPCFVLIVEGSLQLPLFLGKLFTPEN